MPPADHIRESDTAAARPKPRRPLRLWPGVVFAALMLALRFVVPVVVPEAGPAAFLGTMACALAIFLWWLFFSRALWSDRIGGVVLVAAGLALMKQLVHPSIAGGHMGMMPFVLGLPAVALALVVAVVLTRDLSTAARRGAITAAVLLACGMFTLLRTDGIQSTGMPDLDWRWAPTPEQRLLAESRDGTSTGRGQKSAGRTAPAAMAAAKASPVWPGFRGSERDGIVRGVEIETDWAVAAPRQLWSRPVGPGWSSFAVDGDRFYTQEQRGEEELVSCYDLATGEPVWMHADATRFYESNAGPGPRATPTLHEGRVYTLGATGVLNALDARTGAQIWERNAAADTKRKVPPWGFASSPLIVGDLVVIALSGKLAVFDLATGNPRWIAEKGGYGYSSPHFATIEGLPQILLLNGTGAIGVAPADGAVLWQHEWKSDGIVQPTVLADGDVLIGSGSGLGVKVGIRRVVVRRGPGGWTTEEKWTSNRLKPYFNDYVVHRDHAYGFDGSGLACIELAGGERKWRGGRYGQGQLLLLGDQSVLLVVGEQGDIALVRAAPDEFKEIARLPSVNGKTWNHPVLAGDVLLVRNDHEMVAFRLKLKSGAAGAE